MYNTLINTLVYLCKKFNINPIAKVDRVPTILSHDEAGNLGFAVPHIDLEPWFSKFNKPMKILRKEVNNKLNGFS